LGPEKNAYNWGGGKGGWVVVFKKRNCKG